MFDLFAALHPGDEPGDFALLFLRYENINIASDHLRGGITVDFFGALVPECDYAVEARADDGVLRVLDDARVQTAF